MYVFSRDSYIGEASTGLELDENRETPEQGSLISAIPRPIQVVLVCYTTLQVFPRPPNVSPASLELFLSKTTIPAGFVPSTLWFSHDISFEAVLMEILDKDGRNPAGNVPRRQIMSKVPLGMLGSSLNHPWMPGNIRNRSDWLAQDQNQPSLLQGFSVCMPVQASVSPENTARPRKSRDPQDL